MKYILTILFVLASCLTPLEKYNKRKERAKRKIESIVNTFPELKLVKDTIIIVKDTIVRDKQVVINDTIVTNTITIDTVFNTLYKDTVFTFSDKFNIIKGVIDIKQDAVKVNITKYPEVIYRTDTINIKDTLYREKIVTNVKEVINTTTSFSYWLTSNLKALIILFIYLLLFLIILYLIYKYIK
jgi:hypothetical protein